MKWIKLIPIYIVWFTLIAIALLFTLLHHAVKICGNTVSAAMDYMEEKAKRLR